MGSALQTRARMRCATTKSAMATSFRRASPRWFFAALVGTLVSSTAFAAAPLPVRRVALVLGANDGGVGRPALRFAQSDAQKIEQVFVDVGLVAPTDLIRLEQPTVAAIEQALAQTEHALLQAKEQGAHAEVVLYYSGHSDDSALLIGNERLPYATLRKHVEMLSADVHIVILDSCASGAFTRPKGGVHRPAFLVEEDRRARGFAYLTSSAADEVAQESDRLGGSFFTQALVAGLRGAADLEGDGRVTLHEAYQFAYRATLSDTEKTLFGPQHAAYEIALRGAGDVVITDLSAANALLVLGASLDGDVMLRDPRGHLVAAFDKSPGREERLAVSEGNYVMTLRNRAGVLRAEFAVTAPRHSVTPFDFTSVPSTPSTIRGTSLPPPLIAADGIEVERARLQYEAERISVRDHDGEPTLYVGAGRVRIDGEEFYDHIGRTDLADQYRANAKNMQMFSLGGLAVELAGVAVAGSALAAASLIGTGPIAGVVFIGLAVVAGIVSLSGAGLASVGILTDPHPLSARQNAELAHAYNSALRERLKLPAEIDTGTTTLPAPRREPLDLRPFGPR